MRAHRFCDVEQKVDTLTDLKMFSLTSSLRGLGLDSLGCKEILLLPEQLGRVVKRREVLEQT